MDHRLRCVAKQRRLTTFDGRTTGVRPRNGRGPDWRVASTRPTKISRHSLVAAKGAGAPDVRYPVAASRLRIFSLVSRQPPLECRARRPAPSTRTRLESNPPSRFLDARSSPPRCLRPWIPFRRDGSRDFERGRYTPLSRNYEGETLEKPLNRRESCVAVENGCRHVCLYLLYYYTRTFTLSYYYSFARNTIISSRCRARSVCKHVYVNSCRVLFAVGVSSFDRSHAVNYFAGEENEERIVACVCVCVSQRNRGQSEKSASTMNWWKVRAVVNPSETSPGCEGMLVSGAESTRDVTSLT